ncbi:hypothetical protein TRFO_19148 [Tritrichomonas foetus]|uniref:RSE1/DDB1/CPSF1 first beta-propeller domain-containing protein n=1 Tax=Tritrichomonas foetus TaxID=1144522 RepID=A0A1J4KJA1_9EUKA|nr:hypothetical protein TRFO_19148 [Tritrichomonas foetus]|eukprot:OHT11415.1 hypothetical protein TRFO_19148 [Tritrichomonas foetus]
MDFAVSEVFPASAVNDAVLVSCFTEDNDALVLARGNKLIVYLVEDEFVGEPKSYDIYGEIEKIIPVRYSRSNQSNLLVILTDLRTCILKSDDYDPSKLVTVSTGTLEHTWDASRGPIRYAIHPTCIIIQLEQYQLDVFPITSNCTLDEPFQIRIGRKKIMNFEFIGPTSKVTRLVVMTEEFSKPPCLHLYDIDSTNRTFSEDSSFDVTLENSYLMIPYDLDTHSLVVVFSSDKATRVLYNELTPVQKTATIFTNNPIVKMIPLTPDFYVAIDQVNNLFAVRLEEVGQVRFTQVSKSPPPSEVVAITSNLVFVGSQKEDSIFLTVNHDTGNNSYAVSVFDTIRSTGQILAYRQFGNSILSIYERAIVKSQVMCEFSPLLQIECSNFSRVFSFYYEAKEISCYVLSNDDITKIIGRNMDGEIIEFDEIFDLDSPTFSFNELGNDTFLQITENKIILVKEDKEIEVHNLLNPVIHSVVCENLIAIATLNFTNKIENYVSLFEISEGKIKEKIKYNVNGSITAIALSRYFLAIAISCPYKINIYGLDNSDILNSFNTGITIDLSFFGNILYALSPSNNVYIIQPDLNTIDCLECAGNHNQLKFLQNGQMVVCGTQPAIIQNEKVYPLNLSKVIDATISDGQVVFLTQNSLQIGNIDQPHYVNKSYTSKCHIVDIISFNDFYVIARFNPKGQIVFYISDDMLGNTQVYPFGGLKKNEKYVGYYISQNNLYISTNNKIIRYCYQNDTFELYGSKPFKKQIFKIGAFRDYLLIQLCEDIQFYHVINRDDRKCTLQQSPLNISNNGRVMCSAFNDQIIAFMYSKKIISIYSFDDFNERFVPLPQPYQSSETVTALSIVGETVIITTKSGNIFSLDMVDTQPKYDIVSRCTFNVGVRVVNMTTLPDNTLMIGATDGMTLRVESLRPKSGRFYELYKILAQKMKSVGFFRKDFQRSAKFGHNLTVSMQMCDYDLVRTFLQLNEQEQKAVLEGTDISVEQAKEILRID